MDTTEQIDRFLNTAERTRAARPGSERRAALQRLLCRYADSLRTVRDTLAQKLAEGDDWLTAHAGHAQFVQLEDQWLGWLKTYETVCDALAQALDAWLTEGSSA